VLRKGNGQEWFPVQLKWPFLRQQLPYGEWELFHHSPIFTLITILFKIASANLYKWLTKPKTKPTKRTAYLLHLNIKQDQKGQLQSQFLHQHLNQRLCLSRDRVVSNNGWSLRLAKRPRETKENALRQIWKLPAGKPFNPAGNTPHRYNAKYAKNSPIITTPNMPKIAQ